MEKKAKENDDIQIVDLEAYRFSPPTEMGWTVKEYQQWLEDIQQKKSAADKY